MAELVGDAYVRVHADTRFMARAIRRDMEKNGEEGAQSLLKSFDKTLRREADTRLKGAQQELARAIVGKDFDNLLRKSGKSIEDFTADIERDLRKIAGRGGFKDLDVALESLDDWAKRSIVARTVREDADALDRAWVEATKVNKAFDDYRDRVAKATVEVRKMNLNAVRGDMKALQFQMKRADDEWDRMHLAALKVNKEFDETHTRRVPLLRRGFRDLGGTIRGLDDALRKFDASGGIGRLFGKGSRNNFVNFIGSAIGGIAALAEGIIEFPVHALRNIIDNIANASASGKGGLASVILGIAASAAEAIPVLIGLGLILAGLGISLPLLASAASLLLGGLTAIVGALTFGVLGALLPLAPLLAAVAAGFTATFIAMKKAKEKSSEVKAEWGKVQKAWTDLTDSLEPGIDKVIGSIRRLLVPFFDGFLKPLLEGSLDAINRVVKDLGGTFKDPNMRKFVDLWVSALPVIFTTLGKAVNDLLAALLAFFTPILPYAAQLALNFGGMTDNFKKWAESAKGQNSIKNFMDDAFHAASTLWDIIKNIATAIGGTFGAGQKEAGQPFLDYLDDLTKRWSDWVNSVGGQETLKQWFADAKEAGDKLFTIIGDVFDFFEQLDTEESRKQLLDLADAIERLSGHAEGLANLVDKISTFFDVVGAAGPGALTMVNLLALGYQMLEGALSGLAGFMEQLGQQLYNLFTNPWKWIYDTLFGHSIIPDILRGFGMLTAIPGIISGALAGVVGLFTGPFNTAKTGVSRALSAIGSTISSIAGGFAGIAGRVVSGVTSALSHPFTVARDTISGIMGEIGRLIARIPGLQQAAKAGQAIVRGLVKTAIDLYNKLPGVPDVKMAAGGITNGPTTVGENGRELVIPLERPLPMVNRGVRDLAELLRGGGGGPSIAPGAIAVTIPNADPWNVAEAVLDRIVARL